MAGKVANKLHVTKFSSLEYNNAPYLDTNQSRVWNMEEDEVLDQLNDESFNNRVEILEQLLIKVRRSGGKLPYRDPKAIFNGLAQALKDSNWDVRLKCIQLINEVIPQFGDDLDPCMTVVLGKLIPNIGESKITVRRAVIQTLHVYMKHTRRVQGLLKAIVQYGLDNNDPRVEKETIIALPMLFTPEFGRENFFDITQSLARKLLNSSLEDSIRENVLTTMEKIRNLVGEREFTSYIQKLAVPLRRYYCQLTNSDIDLQDGYNSGSTTPRNSKPFSKSTQMPNSSRAQYVESYEFGIVPSHVMNQINDQENFKLRAQGVEEMKRIVGDLQHQEIAGNLLPHMMPFISFLNNLLDDNYFKTTTVTLEILEILVEKLGQNVKQFLKPLSSTLAKRMGDNKIVVRQAVMKVAIKMMQSYQAKPVLSVILENNLTHKNSRVRQETINILIAALLTFPSYDFDLPKICKTIAPLLTDSKRQVRQAVLECFAVIAQAMGQGRMQPLVHAVDTVELMNEGEGVMAAVQARLARRQLPRLNSDRLVEYATPMPSSASSRSQYVHGADIEWIMAVGGSGSSARQYSRSDTMELESVSSSARSTPNVIPSESLTPTNRTRFLSAGRGRSKLPWEEDQEERGKSMTQLFNDGPPKARHMWSEDSGPSQDSNSNGSYTQNYLNRKKNNQSAKVNSSVLGGLDLAETDRESKIKLNHNQHGQYKPQVRPFLEVTGNLDVLPSNTHNEEAYWRGKDDESPIPTKAALARSATKRSTPKKVPPIPAQSTERLVSHQREDDGDSAYATSLESTLAEESHMEMMKYLKSIHGGPKMMHSLKSIRSSASKKKEKISSRHGSQRSISSRSRSPSPDTHESGIWSTASSNRDSESDANSLSSRGRKGKKTESPFESKPKLARTNSLERKPHDLTVDTNKNEIGKSVIRIDYNPSSGVTFRENRTSDVQVVGKGYNDEPNETKPIIMGANGRRRRVQPKGPLLSPLGVASVNSHGALDWDDDKIPTSDGIGVIGKGMFDSSNGFEHSSTGNNQSKDNDKKPQRSDRKDFTSGVVGVSVNNRTGSNDELFNDYAEEEDLNKSMSKAMRERLEKAQKKKEEEAEQQRIEREKKKQEHDEKLRKERERQQEKLRRLNTNESIGIESISISNPPGPPNQPGPPTPKTRASPSLSPRKSIKKTSSQTSETSKSMLESDNPDDWQPYRDPDHALRDAMNSLSNEEWEVKCSGLNSIRRLALFHPDTVTSQLHNILVATLKEVKNLRSQVSRLAIISIGDMFTHLHKKMDADIDITAKALLAKSGESNGFIREDVDKVLAAMVNYITPQRSLLALISGGATHKNVAVRQTTSNYVVGVVEKMGPGKVLSGVKDITDRILPTAAHFCLDSSPKTRFNGRRILATLMSHPDFNKMLEKHLPANTLRNIKEIVDIIKIKGLGEIPSESSSARGLRSGPSSRAGSTLRGGSAGSENVNNSSPKKYVRTDEGTQDEIKRMTNMISSNDWRERLQGITQLLEFCESHAQVVAVNATKIFDKFLPRLQDPNSKVNLFALQVFQQIIPLLSDSLAVVLNMAVGNVAPNLSSKNKEIYTTAMDIISALMQNIDGGLLLQPLSNQAQSASARSKPDLVVKVAELVRSVYSRKQKQVVLHVLPLLWHLLGATNSSGAVQGGSSSIRTATHALVHALYSEMGQALMEKAQADASVTPRHLDLLNELLER
ncbi:TOG array regulator of axonemal microtubules protein 1-like isoform X5 [Mytilus californianus]|uniref:TOG array regulator of axonemal microtubules protein 1-like isoform X5 n=1 Tax=Mytilus californianus TaxID=6549 RepID=UPI0022473E99|nr:TOG array regulator of axonemal microtubules protein 1-like isoform X5 [Mytilus californianus]